jgi:hypothetical protein
MSLSTIIQITKEKETHIRCRHFSLTIFYNLSSKSNLSMLLVKYHYRSIDFNNTFFTFLFIKHAPFSNYLLTHRTDTLFFSSILTQTFLFSWNLNQYDKRIFLSQVFFFNNLLKQHFINKETILSIMINYTLIIFHFKQEPPINHSILSTKIQKSIITPYEHSTKFLEILVLAVHLLQRFTRRIIKQISEKI